jgi:acetylornithine deacetylase/succinyl-diaminopimelate desuccinylase-like protein
MRSVTVHEYVARNLDRFVSDFAELVAFPSVSATGQGIERCADHVESLCLAYGFDETSVVETAGHPAIIGHSYVDQNPDNDAPTVLIYGHYDVQPVDRDEWSSPPFEPEIRRAADGSERLYGRGASDNKGQWFAHLCAIRALRETDGLPVNVTLVLDGEEESGSENLRAVVADNAEALDAELVYISDGPVDDSGTPHVLMGSRGLLYGEIDVRGPDRDLHSGNYGGPVPNPAWELVELLASMRGDDGTVEIEGFYDDVQEITDADREVLDGIPFDGEAVMSDLGINEFDDGPGNTFLEQVLYQPTLNISGLTSGYGGEGTKTIIPSDAQAKVGMRLVPDQHPDDIWDRFEDHVETHTSEETEVTATRLESMTPQRTPLDSPFADLIVRAVRDAWNDEPILKPSLGGSLPAYVFAEELGLPCIVVPYGNSDQNNHSPDENMTLSYFERGIRTTANVLSAVATSSSE